MVTISLCMIVRDEEAVLDRCLASVKGLVDEIIVVDTGSIDRTKEIAARYTENIYDFVWKDDFAAARNESFSKATMNYCMWLDADDVFPDKEAQKFLAWKEHADGSADVVMVNYATGFDEEGNISFEESSMIRAKSPDWERKFGIQEDDIIMTSKGSVLKMCIVTPDMPKAFLCGNLTRIRVDQRKYSPYVLYEFLNSKEGRNVLNSIQSGTTIKVFNNTNLSRLPVPDYENPGELQQQLKRIYQEYRMSVKEAESRFETKRKKLLSNLQ